ncbi:glycosyltransferase involved in cell wall biosynthesis [Rhizobium sp. PP-F2F-G38]|nr:glycosyltransferase involved in cell wall biosynthesis [Rhizobium sp. PP-WC-1G-195]PYE98595.1 glycosyltransferase involved in cell wall biosynthesis [Rhizobium sp. PP-F2F-G38]
MTKPRVMIDGYNLALEKGTGIATYARNLSGHLSELGYPIDLLYGVRASVGKNALLSEVGFFDPSTRALKPTEVIKRLATSPLGTTARQVPITGKVIARHVPGGLPKHERIFNSRNLYTISRWHFRTYGQFMQTNYDQSADIAHWTYPLPIKLKNAANIYTIHDLVPLRLPYATLDNKREFLKTVRKIADKADHIVTVSEVSKRDIVELLGVDERRVTNTYQAVNLPSHILNRDEDEVRNEVASIFGLEHKKFFLFFGAIEPKKNIGRIIEAYLASQVSYPLVIVGQLVWKNANDLRLLGVPGGGKKTDVYDPTIGHVTRSSSIVRLEYLPLSLLMSLIRCARSVVFPSLYEGFGLPILEAMQLGTAVITGSEGANPEIAGDSAIVVDPYDVNAIAQAIRDVAHDDALMRYYEAEGLERAKLFSPERYAERLDSLYTTLK